MSKIFQSPYGSTSMLKNNVSFSLGYFTHKKSSGNDDSYIRVINHQPKLVSKTKLDKDDKSL